MVTPRAFRATELACELARQGHKVQVIFPCDENQYAEFCSQHDINIRNLGNARWPSVPLTGKGPILLAQRLLRRGLSLFLEFPDIQLVPLVKKCLAKLNPVDLLISIAAPHAIHWGVARALRHRPNLCRTWVADCGDPFMGLKTDRFRKPFYFSFLEKSFCRRADFITIPIPEAIEGYYSEFHHKIRVIPQGFRFDLPGLMTEAPINPIPTFAYAGAFIPGLRDPRPFLDYLSTSTKQFRFLCFTRQPELISGYQSKLDGRLDIRPYLPRQELLEVMAKMDFLVNLENRVSMQSPSKLIDYAIANRPILSVDPLFPDSRKIVRFLDGCYSERLRLPNLQQYQIHIVAQNFLSLTEATKDNAYRT
jgi:hypothetical protein